MRGEHSSHKAVAYGVKGSSPHARGARVTRKMQRSAVGIIPACAGSTSGQWFSTHSTQDHPRMRGEHSASHPPAPLMPGSSPHARGAQALQDSARLHHGIIPACAGSTLERMRKRPPEWDHPRMRGEHIASSASLSSAMGSSPHARGARCDGEKAPNDKGIIPACAGSTLRDQRVWSPFSLNTFTFCKPWPPERSL